jgi:SAM-dependent methyltransferase
MLHTDLPQEGPGTDDATRDALRRLPALPDEPVILDLGCGPGRQTLALAKELNSPVTAIDFHQPYLDQLTASAQEAGLNHLITTRCASFDVLDFPESSVDLIWSEGAIYLLGFGGGLQQWRPMLKPDGLLVASEITWLKPNPPEELEKFWNAGYPAMTNAAGNIQTAKAAGYTVLDHFTLPLNGWEQYMKPLEARIELLEPQQVSVDGLREVLDEQRQEIDLCRRYRDWFSYEFYLMQRTD